MYEIEVTEAFQAWFNGLDTVSSARLEARFDRVKQGNFGDYKALGEGLYELRFFFGSGYRVYYTVRDNKIVLLLAGGGKSSQKKDIKKAREMLSDEDGLE